MKALIALLTLGKLGKVAASGGSMLLSLVVYATVYGWGYAAGIIVMLFCHEMGHYLAARRAGLAVGLPTFIPFVGAWIELKNTDLDPETEAAVAFAGPLAGTISAMACYFLGRELEDFLLVAVAYAGLMLNLFNLLPLGPLDGGRITAILSPRLWLLGVPVLVSLFLYVPSPMLILVAVLAIPSIIKAWRYDPAAEENRRYAGVSAATRTEYALLYLGLAAFLAIMAWEVHESLPRVGMSIG